MKTLADKWYKLMEAGREVKCPKRDCGGLLVKVSGEKFEQASELYWEKTTYYRCRINCKHVWKYLLTPFKQEEISSKF